MGSDSCVVEIGALNLIKEVRVMKSKNSSDSFSSNPFLPESFSRVFGAGAAKGTFRIFNVIIV